MRREIINTYSCSKNWNELQGSGPTRYCSSCNHAVHDLRDKNDTELDLILSNGPVCGIIDRSKTSKSSTVLMAGLLLASVASFISPEMNAQKKPLPKEKPKVKKADEFPQICGIVKGPRINFIPFVEIELRAGDSVLTKTSSDLDGNFSLETKGQSIAPGTILDLQFSQPGYQSLLIRRTIESLTSTELIILLEEIVKPQIIERTTILGMMRREPWAEGLTIKSSPNPDNSQTIYRDEIQRMPR